MRKEIRQKSETKNQEQIERSKHSFPGLLDQSQVAIPLSLPTILVRRLRPRIRVVWRPHLARNAARKRQVRVRKVRKMFREKGQIETAPGKPSFVYIV